MISVFLSAPGSTTPLCAAEEGDEPPAVLLRYGALQLWPSQPFHPTVSISSRCSYRKLSSSSGVSNWAHRIANRQALLALPQSSSVFWKQLLSCSIQSGITTETLITGARIQIISL